MAHYTFGPRELPTSTVLGIATEELVYSNLREAQAWTIEQSIVHLNV